ncbi:JmjC domain-containing protein [Chloropicon primus]|nr:JmjC domain-containing protein [Chloropicon primus]
MGVPYARQRSGGRINIIIVALSVFALASLCSLRWYRGARPPPRRLSGLIRGDDTPTDSGEGSPGEVQRRDGLHIVPITRIPAGSISVKEFFDKHGDEVVIVEGEARSHPAFGLGWQGLKDLCGGSTIETTTYSETAADWAGLEDTKKMKLATYIERHVLSGGGGEEELRYASGGVGIPELCPPLDHFAKIPSFVSSALIPVDQVYNNATEGGEAKYLQQGQPEVFIGPAGTKSELHMDSMLIPFWMVVYEGKKTFRTILYNETRSSQALSFYEDQDRPSTTIRSKGPGEEETRQLEVWNPDLEAFPDLADVTVHEGTLVGGDFIYLPPATLHAVYNHERSWAVSSNSLYPSTFDKFVDVCHETDFGLYCKEFATESAGCDPDVETKEDLRSCLLDSPLVQRIQKEYDEGRLRDKTLHEMSGFDSFEPWCLANCETLRESPIDPSWGYDEIQEHDEVLEYICSRCDYKHEQRGRKPHLL